MTLNQKTAQAIREALTEGEPSSNVLTRTINQAIVADERRATMQIDLDVTLEINIHTFDPKAPVAFTVTALAEVDSGITAIVAQDFGGWTYPGAVSDVKDTIRSLIHPLEVWG